MAALDDELLRYLQDRLATAQLHSARVEGVALERGVDSDGDSALFVRLTLSDPPADKETWPVDDVARLRYMIRDAILELLRDDVSNWYVSFEPATTEAVSEDKTG